MAVSVLAAPALLLIGVVTAPVAGASSPCPAGQPTGSPPGTPPGAPAQGRPNYPLGQCQLVLSSGVIPAGNRVGVSGSGYAANSHVTIAMDPPGTILGTATTDSSGTFNQTVTIPRSTAPGTYTMTGTGTDPSGDPMELTASFTVVPAGSAGGTGGGGANLAGSASGNGAGGSHSGGGSAGSSTGGGASSGSGPSGSTPLAAPVPRHSPGSGSTSTLETAGLAVLALLVVLGGTGGVLWSRRRHLAHGAPGTQG